MLLCQIEEVSMGMMDWWSGAVVWKLRAGTLYFLVQDTRNTNPNFSTDLQTKFPGGKNRDHREDKTPIDTLRRELRHELQMELIGNDHLMIHNFITGFHWPKFYLVHESCLVGTMRTEEDTDGGSIIYPPKWVPVGRELRDSLYDPYNRSHRIAYDKSMKYLWK